MKPSRYAQRRMRARGITMVDVEDAMNNSAYGEVQPVDGRHCLWGWSERHNHYLRIILSPGTDKLVKVFRDSGFTRNYEGNQ